MFITPPSRVRPEGEGGGSDPLPSHPISSKIPRLAPIDPRAWLTQPVPQGPARDTSRKTALVRRPDPHCALLATSHSKPPVYDPGEWGYQGPSSGREGRGEEFIGGGGGGYMGRGRIFIRGKLLFARACFICW